MTLAKANTLKQLSEEIRDATWREMGNMSGRELARRSGLHQTNVSRFLAGKERARNLKMGTIIKIAEALNCDVTFDLTPRI
jgi:transcriptional regulator with XRE-family HTH domain